MPRPSSSEYPSYYDTYIRQVSGEDVLASLKQQHKDTLLFIEQIPASKENYRYSDGKWTVKEVLGHIVDTERIMAYRALSFARGDKSALPGFDENSYTPNGNFSSRTLKSILEEYDHLRQSNLSLFSSFNPDVLLQKGSANGKEVNVRSLIWIIAGHELHHKKVLKERYL